ncbi:XdhC family protein [Vreelandella maris]|uniref:XdhC- CoxI domain-containing protein n=1 Tax=Vreelandella maris TaxID=2729617 RepID=A0A7Y6RH08_9GAMM|nr:hypothetical protein [Halomonas maris]
MLDLDSQVIAQSLDWVRSGQTVWLCTVLSTYGSSPRVPGAMLVARSDGKYVGSLSGGCVEDDFIARLKEGAFFQPTTPVRYGETRAEELRLALPCGGILEILVERRESGTDWLNHLVKLHATRLGQQRLVRKVEPGTGECEVIRRATCYPNAEQYPYSN